ncbi:hypothetical protein [Alteraurantiacibacter aquimixticola]|uniref:hypothetical protein n=1 Tax=Alteraurantiacibacter aquimixticola TaxID=2489173 RepID=UPI001B7D7DD7|nr:hypothetical protein [Alteraurantiacibacter aquimixticola]
MATGLALFASFLPATSFACITSAPFVVEDMREADAVFSGRVTSYEIVVSESEFGRPIDHGIITVAVDDVFRGELPASVPLYWGNSTFALPDELMVTEPSLFAAVNADSPGLPLRAPSATIFPNARPDLLQLMQAPCSGSFVLPYASAYRSEVEALLRGEPSSYLDDQGTYAEGVDLEWTQIAAIRRSESPRAVWNGVLWLLVLLAVLAIMLAWRGWRRRGKPA